MFRILAPSWVILSPNLPNLRHPMALLAHLTSSLPNLSPSWKHLGAPDLPKSFIFLCSFNIFDIRPSWPQLRVSSSMLGHLGVNLGPLGGILGPSWAFLGPSWGPLGPSRGPLEPSFFKSWHHLASSCPLSALSSVISWLS